MAGSSFSASARIFKSGVDAAFRFSPVLTGPVQADAVVERSDAPGASACARRAPGKPGWSAPTRGPGAPYEVSPDETVAILAALDEHGGTREIGDLACAIPDCPRPIGAILALADAGRLWIDPAAPFDAATRVTRLD